MPYPLARLLSWFWVDAVSRPHRLWTVPNTFVGWMDRWMDGWTKGITLATTSKVHSLEFNEVFWLFFHFLWLPFHQPYGHRGYRKGTVKCSIEVYTYYMTIRDIHEHPQCAAYDASSSNSNPVLSSESSCLNIEPVLPTQSADFWNPSFLQTRASLNYHTLQKAFTHCGTSPGLISEVGLDLE